MKTRTELQKELTTLRDHWTDVDNRIFAEAHNGKSCNLTALVRYQHKVTQEINFIRLQLLSHNYDQKPIHN